MNTFYELMLWFTVLFPLVFSAGPGNILCAVSGATNGFKQSIPFILGLNLVYTIYSILVGVGLASIFTTYPMFFTFIQLLGSLYILWLGYKFISNNKVNKQETVKKLTFYDGLISQTLNIKGITVIITMYTQFLDIDEPLWYEVTTLSLALLILNLFTHMTWAYGGMWITNKFNSSFVIGIQNKLFGIMLIIVSMVLTYKIVGEY